MRLPRNASAHAGPDRLATEPYGHNAPGGLGTGPERGACATLMTIPALAVAPPRRDTRAGGTFRLRRAGFTLVEMVLVIVLIGIIGAMFFPQISAMTGKDSVARSAQIVQQDLERTFALAARARKPMTLTADNSAHTYQVTDPSSSIVLNRSLALGQEYGVETMTFYPTTITIQPTGVSSDSLGVTLISRGSTRYVSMTRVGLIRRTQ
jgi:prepilin-type N-terminal cleavage/methylation domain-containing protein